MTLEDIDYFKEIKDEIVGYIIKEDSPSILPNSYSLEKLNFELFISVHSMLQGSDSFEEGHNVKEIYDKLRKELIYYKIDVNSMVDNNSERPLIDIANEALDRESIINAMKLIKKHYLD